MAPVAIIVLLVAVIVAPRASAELPRLEHPSNKAHGALTVLAVGDWGRRGQFNQTLVADQMGIIGKKMNIDFIVNVGDNFYDNGLTGVDDKAFEESFTNIYTADSLQKPWYTILGNHDYRGDALAQLNPVLRQLDSQWMCMKSFVVSAATGTTLKIIFMTGEGLLLARITSQTSSSHQDVDSALKQSTATWKIVVGHHPIRSVSEHGDTQELLEQLLPILKANEVDLYINGHDHCLEHISSRDSPLQYLTSGAGSKAWRGSFTPNSDKLEFFYDGQGFMSLRLSKAELHLTFYDVTGNVLHSWSHTKPMR